MTIDDKIRDEKIQYDINSEAAKISVLSYGKIDTYECLKKEQIIEQTKFAYSPLGKTFEKQTEKQVDVIKSLDLGILRVYFHKI